MKKSVNRKLNFIKGLACIGVVFIHVTFPGRVGNIVLAVSSYAVPIFYMIAGYYIYGKDTDVVKRRLIKIVKILIYGYTLHFLYGVINSFIKYELETWFNINFNWKTPIKYIVFCMVDFAPLLWYLIAMIEIYIVWCFIVKGNKEQFALKFIPVLFVFQIALNVFCEKMGLWYMWRTNFISQAMPWFLLGYYMRTNKGEKIKNMDSYKLLVMAMIGCIIVTIPAAFGISSGISCIGYLPYAMGMFALALKSENNSTCKLIEYVGEKLSLYIYILHNIVAGVITIIGNRILSIDITSGVWMWCKPVIVLICTTFVAWILCVTKGKIKDICT